MYDVVTLGEALIDFTPSGKSEAGMRLFEQNPGGAVANAICALGNFGLKTAFIGKVGRDMHGDMLMRTFSDMGVDIKNMIQDDNVFTTLAFVELSDIGERSFSFSRKPGADTCLTVDELNQDMLKSCKIFHFGSLSMTDEPARSATLAAIDIAKAAGAVISYDPNYRATLWRGRDEAVERMRSVLDKVDIIKISDEETELLTDKKNPGDAAGFLLKKGIGCVVVTLGKDGALAASKETKYKVQVPPPTVKVLDTTGAGDAFWSGFLYKIITEGFQPAKLGTDQLSAYVMFANAVASLCVQKRGGIPSMPSIETAVELYEKHRANIKAILI